MSSNNNRPTRFGPGGFTPGETPSSSNQPNRPGAYSRYNQPAPNTGATEFGINPYGEPIAEEAEAGEAFLEEAERILDSIKDTAAKVERSEALVKRLERAGIERGAEASVEAERAEGSATRAEGSAARAEGSAERAEGSAEDALDLVRETEYLIDIFKKETSDVADEQRAQLTAILTDIDEQMRALEEKTKELANKEKIAPEIIETLEQGVQTIKNTVKTTNNANNQKKQEFIRQKMGISFISFEGHTNILNPFSKNKTNSNIINPILPVNFNVNLEGVGDFFDVPAGNYLFVDNFRLRLDDFRNMNRSDFIQLILNPLKYIDFLKALERSSVERQFIDFRNKQNLSKDEKKIYKENAKIYAAKLFAPQSNFNIVYQEQNSRQGGYYFDYTIMSHELMKKNIEGPDAFRFDVSTNEITDAMRNTNYTFFNFKIKLILDSREQSEITSDDIKRVGCDQRRARIFRIMGSLDGTKQIVTAIMGPEGAKKYLVDDTKMEQIHGRAKPLPSKKRQFLQDKSMLDKLSYVTQINKSDLPMSRNEEMRRMRLQSQPRMPLANVSIGGKRTKRISYAKKHKNSKTKKNYLKKSLNKKKKNFKKMKKTKKL